jgi:hypothetical protein
LEQDEIERLLGGAPRLLLDDIVEHPRLAEARKAYLAHFLNLYGGDPFVVRLLIEAGRFLVYHVAIVLDAAQDPTRRETWLTIGLLKRALATYGVASSRHIDEIIARLCAVGFMEQRPSDQDRRVRLLLLTEKMRAHDRDWLVAHFAPLAVCYPAHGYAPVMQRDAEFQTVYRRVCTPFLPLGIKLLLSLPDTMLFFNHAAGSPIISALLQAATASPDYPHAAVPYAEVGERFGVSRTHVRKLLVAAEQAGLVKLHARGGQRVEILPRLWSSYDRGLATGMYVHDMTYLATMKHLLAHDNAPSDWDARASLLNDPNPAFK